MLAAPTIQKEPENELALNHERLYAAGLEHVQRLASRIWTDYNVHDPGITTLELLSYALTDLSYRASFPVPDLLATETGEPAEFFTARSILPNRALTLLDYRKLLIDLKGVKNAWLEPAKLTYYADTINGTLSKEESDEPGIKPVGIRGLYNVIIDFDDGITSTAQKSEIMDTVKVRLQAERNLCEDFAGFQEVLTQNFVLCCELEISPETDVSKLAAEIYFAVQQYLAPSVRNYTLNEMLARKKDEASFTVDEIFNGPALDCGFIDDEELRRAELREKIYLSDVISEIMDLAGVRAVKDIVINPEGTKTALENKWVVPVVAGRKALLDRERSRLVFYKRNMPVTADKAKATARYDVLVKESRAKAERSEAYDLAIAPGNYRRLASYYSFQNHFPNLYGLSEDGLSGAAGERRKALAYQLKGYLLFFDQVMANYLAQLSHVKDLLSRDPDLERTYFPQTVDFRNCEEIYRSIFTAEDLIDLPGLAAKLQDSADEVSTFLQSALAAPTKQLLANYAGAEAQAKRLQDALVADLNAVIQAGPVSATPPIYDAALSAGVRLSEESQELQKLQKAEPKATRLVRLNRLVLNDAYPGLFASYDREDPLAFVERRNRFLDHLIARFAEQFTDYAHISYAALGDTPRDMIATKCSFLEDYPAQSSRRSIAYNYTLQSPDALWNSDNISGLERRLAKLLGIRNFTRRNLSNIAYGVYAEIDSTPGDEFRWRIYEQNGGGIALSSSTRYLTRQLAKQEMRTAISFASVPSGYERKMTINNKHYFNIVDDTGEVVGRRIEYFETPEEMETAISDLMEYLRATYSDESMYLIETILLRPEKETDPFLPICPDPNCTDCAEEDPYSYRLHVILPAYSSRFSNMEFRRFAEEVIREEMPAHILPRICWISMDDMASLEKAYRAWIHLKAGIEKTQRKATLQAFIDILFAVRNVYPSQRLHECDAPENEQKFQLGQTALGTMKD